MTRRRVALVACALCCAASVFGQLRDSIAIVRPRLSQFGKETYISISKYFKERRNDDLAEYFESFTKEEGFGSGFLTRDPGGKPIVVTNGHVVLFADKADLEFRDSKGKKHKIDGCPVVYNDDAVDFAAIRVPEDRVSDLAFLSLAEAAPGDGTEVWSAGYPYLIDGPSWQLGRGSITNERVVVPKIGLESDAIFSLHSAPIAPGNSGGPLLTGDPARPGELRVVGINAWMILGRQSGNFAIHLDMVKRALTRVGATGEEDVGAAAEVETKAKELAASLNAREWPRFQASRFVSYKLVADQGWKLFTNSLSRMDSKTVEEWTERFLFGSPVETLREMVHYRLYEALYKTGYHLYVDSVEEMRSPDGERIFRTALSQDQTVYFLDWGCETGSWRIQRAGVPTAGLKGPESSTTDAISIKAKVKDQKPVEPMPVDGYKLHSGPLVLTGGSVVPTIYGWAIGIAAEASYSLVLGTATTLSLGVVYSVGAGLVEDDAQELEASTGLKVSALHGFPIVLRKTSFVPHAGFSAVVGLGIADIDLKISAAPEFGLTLLTGPKLGYRVDIAPSFAFDSHIPRLQGLALVCGVLF